MPSPNLLVASPDRSLPRDGEERALFERLQQGDMSARDALVRRFLPLAHKLARGYRGGDDSEDLEQVAAIGLLKAIDRFEPQRGLAFSTFAFPTIVGELKRHFRDRTWIVRVPRSIQELKLRIERGTADLSGHLGRAPTVAELADHVGATSEHVLEALHAGSARRPDSLDRPWDDTDDDTAALRLGADDPDFTRVENDLLLTELFRVLDPRARRILELRFREDLVQSRISERVGISQMQVSRSIRHSIELLQRTAESPSRPLKH